MIKKQLTDIEISSFCMEMAMLLKSGVSLEEGLTLLFQEEQALAGKKLLEALHEDIALGLPFHKAAENTKAFPNHVVHMIFIGEKTGHLEKILHELHAYYESKNDLTLHLKAAVFYPAMMLLMMTGILLVLSLKVLPLFTQLYDELGSGIPASILILTQAVKGFSLVLAALMILLLLVLLISRAYRKIYPHAPVLSLAQNWFQKTKMGISLGQSRFASVLALAFSSGLEMDSAMDLALILVDNPSLRPKIKACKSHLDQGISLSQALQSSALFDGMNAGLIHTGFVSGSIEEMMKLVAVRYQKEANQKISDAVALVEPAIVITLSLFVGLTLFVVMLPLLSIMSTLG